MPQPPDATTTSPLDFRRKSSFAQQLLSWLGIAEAPTDETGTEPMPRGPAPEAEVLGLPASLAGRYRILKALGRGATGVVFQAKDLRIGRIIAIKQLYHKASAESLLHRRFLQEARIAGQLDNPNIVTIYDVDDTVPCILMEYLGGNNLAARIRADAPLPTEMALDIMVGVLKGLAAAHSLSVVHRDVKPSNVLFDQYGIPKLSDFGIAHLPIEAGGLVDDAAEPLGGVAGTPNYMAPEQMIPGGKIDARADLYAVGVMGYEMLTGERPYRLGGKGDLRAIRESIHAAPVPTAADFPPEVPAHVREIVLRLLPRDPTRRFTSATAALDAIAETRAELVTLTGASHLASDVMATRLEMYEDILRLFLVDGVISPPERRELIKRAQRLGIKPRQAAKSEERVRVELDLPLLKDIQQFEDMVKELAAAGQLGDEEREALRHYGSSLGLSEEQQRKIEDAALLRPPVVKSKAGLPA